MRKRLRELFVAAFVVANAISAACGQDVAPAEKLDPQELVIGDWYELSTKRALILHGEGPINGILVKATDDWLVLGAVKTETEERFRFSFLESVHDYMFEQIDRETFMKNHPDITNFVYSGLFLHDIDVHSKLYFWIPRKRANVVTVHKAAPVATKEVFRDADPSISKFQEAVHCEIVFTEPNEVKCRACPSAYFKLEDGGLTAIGRCTVYGVTPHPILGDLPMIGSLFDSRRKMDDVECVGKSLSIDRVCYICQTVPFKVSPKHESAEPQSTPDSSPQKAK